MNEPMNEPMTDPKIPIRANLHSHTYRCKHATGDVTDYAREAVAAGLGVLGMSDHTPFPDGRWSEVRMDLHELPDYLKAIEDAKAAFPELRILRSMECEWTPEYEGFYRDELLGRHQLDYLILGAHYIPAGIQGGRPTGGLDGYRTVWEGVRDPFHLRLHTDFLIASMRSGLFAFVAHPDLFGSAYMAWDAETVACTKAILAAAQDLRLPLEINGYGLRKRMVDAPSGPRRPYPLSPFWELAVGYDIEVLVNSDAHTPEDVVANIEEGLGWVRRLGLKLADWEKVTSKQLSL